MKYSDNQRIQKICNYASKLDEYIKTHQISKEDLLNELTLQWLVTTPLYNIGEQVYYLSDAYKEKHNEIPWGMISGLRHRLERVHIKTASKIIAIIKLPKYKTSSLS